MDFVCRFSCVRFWSLFHQRVLCNQEQPQQREQAGRRIRQVDAGKPVLKRRYLRLNKCLLGKTDRVSLLTNHLNKKQKRKGCTFCLCSSFIQTPLTHGRSRFIWRQRDHPSMEAIERFPFVSLTCSVMKKHQRCNLCSLFYTLEIFSLVFK